MSDENEKSQPSPRNHSWWAYLLWGLGSIVLGILLITRPALTALFLVRAMAVFWLVGGVVDIIRALVARDKGGGWIIAGGIVGILAGIVILGHPILGAVLTLATLFLFAACSAIFYGVVNIVGGAVRGEAASWSWGRFLLGVLQVIIGVFMLWHPVVGTLAFTSVLGIVAIVGGVGATGLAIGSRRRRN